MRRRRAWTPGYRAAVAQLLVGADYVPPRVATPDEAASYPPWDRCCDLIAGSLANLDLQAGSVDPASGVWQRLADQPAFLQDPDPEWDPWQWRYSAVLDLVVYGNHVTLLGDEDWRTQRPGWGTPLPPEHLGLVDLGDGSWEYVYGGAVVPKDRLLHVRRGGHSGDVVSMGLAARFGRSLRGSLTGEEWAARYLDGGGLPPAVIQAQQQLTQEQADGFKEKWRRMLSTGEAMVLPSTATVTPLVSDAQRQQLVEARQWNAQMACIATGVPTHKLGLPGPSMTYQNVEQADIAWRADTLERYGLPVAAAIGKRLMPRGVSVRWQWAQVERVDARTQAEVGEIYARSGVLTIDEIRARIHYPPLGGGAPDPGAQEV